MAILVGYRKFYTVFACSLLIARYVYRMSLSYTAFVWAVWIIVWTSPPVLSAILQLCTKQARRDDHYTAVYQSHNSEEHRPRSSPDIRQTVNNTAYYIIHFYTVCQAFAFVNIAGPMLQGCPHSSSCMSAFTFFSYSPVASLAFRVAGWCVCIAGFIGCLWSRHNLGSEWRGAPEVRDDHKLITSGPYRVTRHPIYTSLLLMMLGSALTTHLYWLSVVECVVVVVAYMIKAVAEERMLLQHFGQQYAVYQKNTYMIMPLIY